MLRGFMYENILPVTTARALSRTTKPPCQTSAFSNGAGSGCRPDVTGPTVTGSSPERQYEREHQRTLPRATPPPPPSGWSRRQSGHRSGQRGFGLRSRSVAGRRLPEPPGPLPVRATARPVDPAVSRTGSEPLPAGRRPAQWSWHRSFRDKHRPRRATTAAASASRSVGGDCPPASTPVRLIMRVSFLVSG